MSSFCLSPDLDNLARGAAALGHRRRLEILLHLSASGACCCKEVVANVDLAQSTVSQHLKLLVEAGLVRHATVGQRSRYEVNSEAMAALLAGMSALAAQCGPRHEAAR